MGKGGISTGMGKGGRGCKQGDEERGEGDKQGDDESKNNLYRPIYAPCKKKNIVYQVALR